MIALKHFVKERNLHSRYMGKCIIGRRLSGVAYREKGKERSVEFQSTDCERILFTLYQAYNDGMKGFNNFPIKIYPERAMERFVSAVRPVMADPNIRNSFVNAYKLFARVNGLEPCNILEMALLYGLENHSKFKFPFRLVEYFKVFAGSDAASISLLPLVTALGGTSVFSKMSLTNLSEIPSYEKAVVSIITSNRFVRDVSIGLTPKSAKALATTFLKGTISMQVEGIKFDLSRVAAPKSIAGLFRGLREFYSSDPSDLKAPKQDTVDVCGDSPALWIDGTSPGGRSPESASVPRLRRISLSGVASKEVLSVALENLPTDSLKVLEVKLHANISADASADVLNLVINFMSSLEEDTLEKVSLKGFNSLNSEFFSALQRHKGELAFVKLHKIASLPDSAKELWKAVGSLPSLKRLSIVQCNLSHKDVRKFASAWGERGHLLSMNLSGNPLGPKGLAAIFPDKVRRLRELFLDGCDITIDTESEDLKESISANELHELSLSNNPKLTASQISMVIPHVKRLDVSHCDLGSEDFEQIIKRMAKLNTLESLDISNNAPEGAGVSSFNSLIRYFSTTKEMCSLRELNIDGLIKDKYMNLYMLFQSIESNGADCFVSIPLQTFNTLGNKKAKIIRVYEKCWNHKGSLDISKFPQVEITVGYSFRGVPKRRLLGIIPRDGRKKAPKTTSIPPYQECIDGIVEEKSFGQILKEFSSELEDFSRVPKAEPPTKGSVVNRKKRENPDLTRSGTKSSGDSSQSDTEHSDGSSHTDTDSSGGGSSTEPSKESGSDGDSLQAESFSLTRTKHRGTWGSHLAQKYSYSSSSSIESSDDDDDDSLYMEARNVEYIQMPESILDYIKANQLDKVLKKLEKNRDKIPLYKTVDRGMNLIHISAKKGNLALLSYVLKWGSSAINDFNREGYSALHLLVQKEKLPKETVARIITMLCDHGLNVNAKARRNRKTALEYVVGRYRRYDQDNWNEWVYDVRWRVTVIKALLLNGARPDAINKDFHTTAWHTACENGFFEAAVMFINASVDPNLRIHGGETGLHLACYNNDLRMISLLIRSGADPKIKNSKGKTGYGILSERKYQDSLDFFDNDEFELDDVLKVFQNQNNSFSQGPRHKEKEFAGKELIFGEGYSIDNSTQDESSMETYESSSSDNKGTPDILIAASLYSPEKKGQKKARMNRPRNYSASSYFFLVDENEMKEAEWDKILASLQKRSERMFDIYYQVMLFEIVEQEYNFQRDLIQQIFKTENKMEIVGMKRKRVARTKGDQDDEVPLGNVTLELFLRNFDLRMWFVEYLERVFSIENYEFYQGASGLQEIDQRYKIVANALMKILYRDYVADTSEVPIALEYETKNKLDAIFDGKSILEIEAAPDVFLEARNEVFSSLNDESFAKFKNSIYYETALKILTTKYRFELY